jgi:hypothetical protein
MDARRGKRARLRVRHSNPREPSAVTNSTLQRDVEEALGLIKTVDVWLEMVGLGGSRLLLTSSTSERVAVLWRQAR